MKGDIRHLYTIFAVRRIKNPVTLFNLDFSF